MDFLVYSLFILAALYIAAELNAQPTPAPIAATVEPQPQPKPAIAAPMPSTNRVVIATETTDDLTQLTSAELRRRCQEAGIKWWKSPTTGKAMRQAEMIAALT